MADQPKGALALIKSNYDKRAEKVSELRGIDETAEGRAYTDEETAKVTELRSELGEIDARLSAQLEVETRSERIQDATSALLGSITDRDSRDGDRVDTRSIGRRFVDAEGLDEWRDRGARGNFSVDMAGMELRAVTDATNDAASAGAWQNPPLQSRVGQLFLDRKNFLIDQLPHGTTSDNSVEYVTDISPLADLANKAVEVTEGSAKPQAGITTEVTTDPVRTVAAWANITRQAAADNAQVMSYLDGRLRYTLKRRVDAQVIAGDGTPPNLEGLTERSNIVTYAPAGAEEWYQSIRHGIALMEAAESVPEIIVLNPADAEIFDLSNDDADGLHAVPNVAGPSARTAWGLRQVRSTAIAAGTALLLDPMAVMVWDRTQPQAFLTDSHASNFISNILTLLLEVRVALSVFDPSGIGEITFNDGS